MNHIPSILFVCMGNICRSPSAEIIWSAKLKEKLGEQAFCCDSAGTISYHTGSPPDSRMAQALQNEGYTPFGISRKLTRQDLIKFDLVLSMDHANHSAVIQMVNGDPQLEQKCHLFCEYTKIDHTREVPDPYYGGSEGFLQVIRLIESGCDQLISTLLEKNQ